MAELEYARGLGPRAFGLVGSTPTEDTMYYLYILFLNNGNLYKGVTSDLKRRIGEHKRGKVISTKNKNPRVIHYESYLFKSDVRRREKFLKTTEGRRLLKQQLRDVLDSHEMSSPSHSTGRPVE